MNERPLHLLKILRIAFSCGLISVIIGFFTFVLSWNLYSFFDGPIPAYKILMFPANVSLVYFWHPILSEEIALVPKVTMMLFGQFVIVSTVVLVLCTVGNWLIDKVFRADTYK